MLTNDSRGRWAEDQAKHLLEAKGYKILHQRYKRRYGEIDLIAQGRDALIAVEVKYRRYLVMLQNLLVCVKGIVSSWL